MWPPRVFALQEQEARGWDVAELAARMDMDVEVVKDFLVGSLDCSPDIAAALGQAFGTSAVFWARLERAYRGISPRDKRTVTT